MPKRNLDHLVITARDVDEAGCSFERLGFFVMPKMTHIELGSHNRILQFADTYIEFVGNIEVTPDVLKQNLAAHLAHGDGPAMISLTSEGLEADHKALTAAGLGPTPIVQARREVVMPNGSCEETASRSFYLWRTDNPNLTLFLSDHPRPDTIWIPAYSRHANTALGIAELTIAAKDVETEAQHFAAVSGLLPSADESSSFLMPRGERVRFISREAAHTLYGASFPSELLDLPARLLDLKIVVGSLETCRSTLLQSNIGFHQERETITVPPAAAHGVSLTFMGDRA